MGAQYLLFEFFCKAELFHTFFAFATLVAERGAVEPSAKPICTTFPARLVALVVATCPCYTIVTGACFPDQKSCTKAMHHSAVSHNMVVNLQCQCDGGGDCRFEATVQRSQGQARSGYFISDCYLVHYWCICRSRLTASQGWEDELIRSLVASDPRICV
ncbi:Hypothetical protein PHPALM_37423 [Phytophthora palmivora]|uniref:Uncharacterized protein n=1 Tax=Phytophthora palmivora TaxID=4796 RepID=A0A2P4WXH6_9STRA|nr:Hypothetical protein PHPALM_37423 [Phytophthora palmivora]